jgi:general nucleoside transport system permease protein
MDGFFSVFTIELLNSGIRLATPVVLAALGGALSSKTGVLNLALESKMLMGAFVGIIASYYFGNSYLGVLVAMIVGGLMGWLFAFLYHKYQVNLAILAIAFNLIILELTVYMMRVMFGNVGTWSDPSIVRLPDFEIPLIKDIPIIGGVLSGYNVIVYFSWFAAIALFVILYKMKVGRHIRAVGENIEAAETVGIKAKMIQTFALVTSGVLSALGGAFLSIGHLKLFTRNMSNGRGWTASAASIFGSAHPIGTFFASQFFGFTEAFAVRVQNVTDWPPNLIELLPHLATLLVLVVIALREKIQQSLARNRFRAKLRAEK